MANLLQGCQQLIQNIFWLFLNLKYFLFLYEDANKTIGYIRSLVKKIWSQEVGKALRIQYGGSMKPSNAKELMAERNIDGGLIGGAALKAADFAGIVNYKD